MAAVKSPVGLDERRTCDPTADFVVGYILEKCPENSDRWEKVPGSFTQPKGTVKDLEMNKKYKFRVKAENIYGVSEPLETTSAIIVKPPYGNSSIRSSPGERR